MNNRLFASLLFILACTFVQKIQAQDFIKLEGRILAADSKEPIPFASIGIPDKGIGNICNETGDFELKIPVADKNAKVCISALGFKEKCLPASTFKAQNHTVFLEPANLQLATVEIKAISAESLVREAIRRIPENYADKPVRYTIYQRQMEVINNKPAYIIESVNEGYRKDKKTDYQFKINKARGIATSDKNRELMNDRWVNVWQVAGFDNLFSFRKPFLHPSKHKNYTFQLKGEELIGADTAYVIAFAPKLAKNGKETPGYSGRLYIHNSTYGLIQVESKENQAFLDKGNNNFEASLINKSCKCEIKYLEMSWTGTYKRFGKKWYLNSGISEVKTLTSGEKYAIPEIAKLSTQLVSTIVQTENTQEIPEEQRVKPFLNHYSKAPKDMNEAFWQQYNVLPLPEGFEKQASQ